MIHHALHCFSCSSDQFTGIIHSDQSCLRLDCAKCGKWIMIIELPRPLDCLKRASRNEELDKQEAT